MAAGAPQRELAEGLFGPPLTGRDWRGPSDYLRLRVQRLIRDAVHMRDGGYPGLLAGRDQLA